MSLMHDVNQKVRELKRVTVDDLVPLFPEWTRYQLSLALRRCSERGWVANEGPRRRTGMGCATGLPPYYYPLEEGKAPQKTVKLRPVPPASVWEIGEKRMGEWPPAFEGGREYMLNHDDEEELAEA